MMLRSTILDQRARVLGAGGGPMSTLYTSTTRNTVAVVATGSARAEEPSGID